MLSWVRDLLGTDSLSPHGICLLWRPELVWTHVVSDAFIAGAYLSIPLALAFLVSKRDDIAFGWVFWCFVTFILACGTTHIISIITLWVPIYGVEALVKVVTAIASTARLAVPQSVDGSIAPLLCTSSALSGMPRATALA